MNFKLTLSQEGRDRLDRAEAQRIQWREMTDQELGKQLESYMNNSEPPKWQAGDNVYDAVLWHIALPEVIKRLKAMEDDQ